jgi:hypothetical protein
MPKHVKRGVSDITLVHLGCPHFLEVKGNGTYQCPDQKQFQKEVEVAEARYEVIRSIDDL